MTSFSPQPNNNLSDGDIELLSAYLDDELTSTERAQVETRMQQEPELRSELEALRSTVSLLHDLPAVAPPRSFTLDPAEVQPRRPSFLAWFGTLQGAGALVALVLAVSVTTVVVVGGTMGSGAEMAEAPMSADQAVPEAEMTEEDAPAAAMVAPSAAPTAHAAAEPQAGAPAAEDASGEGAPVPALPEEEAAGDAPAMGVPEAAPAEEEAAEAELAEEAPAMEMAEEEAEEAPAEIAEEEAEEEVPETLAPPATATVRPSPPATQPAAENGALDEGMQSQPQESPIISDGDDDGDTALERSTRISPDTREPAIEQESLPEQPQGRSLTPVLVIVVAVLVALGAVVGFWFARRRSS
jgi:anti-sigma factor RsiW